MSTAKYESINRDIDGTLSRGSSDRGSEPLNDESLEDSYAGDINRSLKHVTSREGVADVESGIGSSDNRGQRHRGQRRVSDASRKKQQKVAAWRDLPKKTQLIVITMTRLSEPLVQTSLQVSSSGWSQGVRG